MKKGQVYEAVVDRVDFPGRGIVHMEDGAVIIKNCLPGQKIRFLVSKVRNGKAEGRLLEVLEPSPQETGQPCSRFGVCGGCTYLSLPYEEQLIMKEGQMKRLLEQCLNGQKEAWLWEGIKGSPVAYEYRNKMEFSFGDEVKDGPLALGMHKRGSFYDVVTVEDCRIVDEDYRLILGTVREYFAQGGKISYFHRLRHEGYLRHLLVRKASRTGEILVALVTTSQDPWGRQTVVENSEDFKGRANEENNAEDAKGWAGVVGSSEVSKGQASVETDCDTVVGKTGAAENQRQPIGQTHDEQKLLEGFLEKLLALEYSSKLQGRFAGILHIVNDSQADVVQCDRMDVLYGQDFFYEELLGLRFKVSTFSFFQTNSFGAEVLYETVREYIGGLKNEGQDVTSGKVVFDLYSGTGTIAQLMAPSADRVIGVEIVEEAVLAARRNAEENGLSNCEFIAGDVLKVLDSIEEKPDLIILDPPRDGIHPKALPKIIAYGVEHIVYISCKPTSLVRDLEVLSKGGYRVEKAVAVDQFPWTANCEVIVLLTKEK
ncbi:MAG: class I SAM-dependent RNA methyltransferase [Lachnospiraceae bacterium]|nr:class I SAM-dependent RNA methyltransferase [Lachnospiraceae bacterium]